MNKWEYRVTFVSCLDNKLENTEDELNRLGLEGWELVTVDECGWLYLK